MDGAEYVERVSDTLPMFPLNAVLFPGCSVPLHVFEDRYRALVHHLLRVEDPTERLFGSVGIREGYEVGDHGAQSLYRIGCRVQLTEVEAHADGTLRHRRGRPATGSSCERLDTTGTFPVGPGRRPARAPRHGARGRSLEQAPGDVRGLPRRAQRDPRRPLRGRRCRGTRRTSPGRLAACAPLPLHERQALLEAEDAAQRLRLVTDLLRARAAGDERDPVAAGHRGRPHPLVAQLRPGSPSPSVGGEPQHRVRDRRRPRP